MHRKYLWLYSVVFALFLVSCETGSQQARPDAAPEQTRNLASVHEAKSLEDVVRIQKEIVVPDGFRFVREGEVFREIPALTYGYSSGEYGLTFVLTTRSNFFDIAKSLGVRDFDREKTRGNFFSRLVRYEKEKDRTIVYLYNYEYFPFEGLAGSGNDFYGGAVAMVIVAKGYGLRGNQTGQEALARLDGVKLPSGKTLKEDFFDGVRATLKGSVRIVTKPPPNR